MRRSPGVLVAAAAAAALAGWILASGAEHGRPAAPSPPRLVVVIAVDGLSWARLSSWRPWCVAGLKRLLDEGAVATACRYEHLNTETGPGHASISTGAPPRVHGIAINQWYVPAADGTKMATVYCADDPQPPGATGKAVRGAGRLEAATLGDRLVARDARAKVVSVSMKDRSAILMAGKDPRHAAYWYDWRDGTFVTSAAYDAASPTGAAVARVVARFNAEKAGASAVSHYGTVVDRLPVPDPPPRPGFEAVPETRQDPQAGTGFPRDIAKVRRPYASALLWTPLSDRMLADLALDLVDDEALGLGLDEATDVLWVSFSANDYVAHYYGPESEDDLEILRGLDVQLGRILDELTRRFGRDAVDVVLSADHGMMPLAESTHPEFPGLRTSRIKDAEIVRRLNAAVDAALRLDPAARPVFRLEGCSLWLDRALLARPGAPPVARVMDVVRRELATTWSDRIERTIPLDPAPERAERGTVGAPAWNAFVPGRSGDLFVIARPGVLVDPYEGTGTSHGTPWDYDTHVPLVWWGGGIAARTIDGPSTPYDIAPTIASWLGVTLPEATGTRMNVREAVPAARR